VWAEEHVVGERRLDPSLQVLDGQGSVDAEAGGVLEGALNAFAVETSSRAILARRASSRRFAERVAREKESKTAATWKTRRPRNERTSVRSIIQTWFTKRAITGRPVARAGAPGERCGRFAVILRTERAETFHPARARVRAIAS